MKYYQSNHQKTAKWKTGNLRYGELAAPESYEDFVAKFFYKYKENAASIRKGDLCKILIEPEHFILKSPRERFYFMQAINIKQIVEWAKKLQSDYPEMIAQISKMKKATADVGVVYFVEAEGTGFIKIGKTNNIEKRLRSLQTATPHRLILRKCLTGATHEKNMHDFYKEYKIRGEWYKLDGKLKDYVDSLPDPSLKDGVVEWYYDAQ
jgi:hypothetical protein